jgi:trimeric autotransporter adhesin
VITPVNASLRSIVTPVIYVSVRPDGTMGNVVGFKLGMTLKRHPAEKLVAGSDINAFATKTFVLAIAIFELATVPAISQQPSRVPRSSRDAARPMMAVSTPINGPSALAVDNGGHLFVIEMQESRVLQIDLGSGAISPVAGQSHQQQCSDAKQGPVVDACLEYPVSLALDSSGNLLIAEMRGRVRKVDFNTGEITTVAGGGQNKTLEGAAALSAHFGDIDGIAVDAQDDLFVASPELEEIFKVDSVSGTVSRFAGNGTRGHSGDGGLATNASFDFGSTISLDAEGNLLIGDYGNCRIRRVDHVTTTVTTIAVTGQLAPDGSCVVSNLEAEPLPSDPASDRNGNVYFVEGAMDLVRRIDLQSLSVSTIAGTGAKGFGGDNGPADKALLNDPSGLAIDMEGNIFVAEFVNNRIRRIDAKSGIITTIGGNGLPHRIDPMM